MDPNSQNQPNPSPIEGVTEQPAVQAEPSTPAPVGPVSQPESAPMSAEPVQPPADGSAAPINSTPVAPLPKKKSMTPILVAVVVLVVIALAAVAYVALG